MPDNIPVSGSSGGPYTTSTEEITTLNGAAVAAQHVQRVVPSLRTADGTAVDVTSGNPLPVGDGGGSLTVDGVFFQATQPVSLATNTPDVTDRAARLLGVVASISGALPAGTNSIGSVVNAAGTNQIGALLPATLVATAVSAANTAVTLTIPLVAGQFHYISRIAIERVATTAIVGSALLTYTSTNLNGWARTTGNAAPVGVQQKDVDDSLGPELRSQAAGTATTIVAPAAGATGIVRITVYYRTAA